MTDRENFVSWRLLASRRQGAHMRSEVRRKRVLGRYDFKTLRRLG